VLVRFIPKKEIFFSLVIVSSNPQDSHELPGPKEEFLMNARLALTAMLLMMSIASGSATIRISDDHG